MVETVRSELGPIDVLVNNATYRPQSSFLNASRAELDRVLDVNFRGLFLTTQHVLPDMLEGGGGSVVNLLGQMVSLGTFGHVHSFGSKLGIERMVRQLATEFGPDGIRVNGLSPGLIDVDREPTDEWVASSGTSSTRRRSAASDGWTKWPTPAVISPPTAPPSSPGRCSTSTAGRIRRRRWFHARRDHLGRH